MPIDPDALERMKRPRYVGIPTFMRAPYTEDLAGVDIGMIGVPYDGGVTNRPGPRHGPREVRSQSSMMRTINQATGAAPYEQVDIADIGDAFVEKPFHLEDAHGEIEKVFRRVVAAGVVPLAVGGDHSISLPILRAVGAGRPVGMVHIDAHCDTSVGEHLGSRFHHGAPFSRAVEEGVLDPKRTVQIGIRGGINARDQWQFSYDSGMRGTLWASQVAVSEENGLTLRLYGSKGGLKWRQEVPNEMVFMPIDGRPQLVTRGGAGLGDRRARDGRVE